MCYYHYGSIIMNFLTCLILLKKLSRQVFNNFSVILATLWNPICVLIFYSFKTNNTKKNSIFLESLDNFNPKQLSRKKYKKKNRNS